MLVKICGTTLGTDAVLAAQAGADYIGMIIEHPASPRCVSTRTARSIRETLEASGSDVQIAAVTVNLPLSQLLVINEILAPHIFQLHGDEGPEVVSALAERGVRVWATCGEESLGNDPRPCARGLLDAGAEAIVVDARARRADGATIYGGTGITSNWTLARDLSDEGTKVVLSGGLKPGNIAMAIEATHPWMVDAVSGVESAPGVKDQEKLQAFITNARRVDAARADGQRAEVG
jgi:phosphoribosylanthranilate isomerase